MYFKVVIEQETPNPFTFLLKTIPCFQQDQLGSDGYIGVVVGLLEVNREGRQRRNSKKAVKPVFDRERLDGLRVERSWGVSLI